MTGRANDATNYTVRADEKRQRGTKATVLFTAIASLMSRNAVGMAAISPRPPSRSRGAAEKH